MKLIPFLKDKIYEIILFVFNIMIVILLLSAFKIEKSLITIIVVIFILFYLSIIFIDYFREKEFYENLLSNIENLEKAYLVLETIEKPNFYEGKLLCKALYSINKSMNENVKVLELQMKDFREYIEMWIHEVKIPIAASLLIMHGNKNKTNIKVSKELNKIEDYVEQVLYYVRQEISEKDYLINEVLLDKVITEVALKNKDSFLENNIELIVGNMNYKVFTDSKWLIFIINQIISNSFKYRRKDTSSYIKINVTNEDNQTILIIEDNGIGIKTEDLPRVFDKSFTGFNGRVLKSSTGMGLYIAKNLCNKLGHKIEIESEYGKYTKVLITFYKNKYYDVLK